MTDDTNDPITPPNGNTDWITSETPKLAPKPVAPADAVRNRCAISGLPTRKRDLVPLDAVRPSLADQIKKEHPELNGDSLISTAQLARYRMKYVEELLESEHGEFTELERQVAASIANHDTIAENVEEDFEEERTTGERLSDHLASFGGSWSFLIAFGAVLVIWIIINLVTGDKRAFDPYPFILFNLILSCLAAVQAPIIMMSQKRQEDERPAACAQRLSGQPQGRTRDPPPARKARSPHFAAMAAAG